MPALASVEVAFPSDVDALKALIIGRDTVIANLSAQLESLKQQILNLRRLHFGASSERLAGQAELFQGKASISGPPEEEIRIPYERKRRGRPALPKDLPRSRIDYDLSQAEKSEFDE